MKVMNSSIKKVQSIGIEEDSYKGCKENIKKKNNPTPTTCPKLLFQQWTNGRRVFLVWTNAIYNLIYDYRIISVVTVPTHPASLPLFVIHILFYCNDFSKLPRYGILFPVCNRPISAHCMINYKLSVLRTNSYFI